MYDGCPLASFPSLAAIEVLRESAAYRTQAVPDEEVFTDRAAMAAALMVDGYGSPPSERDPDGRALYIFVRGTDVDTDTGRAVEQALERVPGSDAGLARRWSLALDTDSALSVRNTARRPFDGLLELWFADAPAATSVTAALASEPGALPVDFFCLVVRENRVI